MWQDIVITICTASSAIVLLPELRDCYKYGKSINLIASSLTTIVVSVLCIVYASLGLWISAIPFTPVVWGLITHYSYRNSKGKI